MNDYHQKIISAIYSVLPTILTCLGLIIFYVFLCDGITELSTKNEIARVLKFEITENAQQSNDSIAVENLYNCLSEAQFNDLIDFAESGEDSLNYHQFKLTAFNREMLARYNKKGKNLLQRIATFDSLGKVSSVNMYTLLVESKEAFLKQIQFRFVLQQNKFNSENISSIEVPIIKYSLPKTFIPNILIIFIIVQLIKLLQNLTRLSHTLKSGNEEIKQLISFYKNDHLPKLNKVITLYYVVLSLSLLTTILLAFNELLFYKLEYPSSDFFYTAHKMLAGLNIAAAIALTTILYFKLHKISVEISKIN